MDLKELVNNAKRIFIFNGENNWWTLTKQIKMMEIEEKGKGRGRERKKRNRWRRTEECGGVQVEEEEENHKEDKGPDNDNQKAHIIKNRNVEGIFVMDRGNTYCNQIYTNIFGITWNDEITKNKTPSCKWVNWAISIIL